MGKGRGACRKGEGGGVVSTGQVFTREVKTRKEVFPLSLSASVVLPQRERKNLIIELLKISLLAESHLHVWEQPSRNQPEDGHFVRGVRHCVTVQSLIATFRNDQIKCLASLTPLLTHPLCGQWMITSITAAECRCCDLKIIIKLNL